MKNLVKWIVENADKFEYDEEGNITNLEIKDMYGNWVYFDAPDFKCGDEFRFIQQPKKVHFEYEDFIEEIKKNGGYVKEAKDNRPYPNAYPIGFLNGDWIHISNHLTKSEPYSYPIFCKKFVRLDGTKFEKEV